MTKDIEKTKKEKNFMWDKKLDLECPCGEPFHKISFRYLNWTHNGKPELYISFWAFYGSFWQRLKRAVKLIFSGWEGLYPNYVETLPEDLEKIKVFCEECLEEFECKNKAKKRTEVKKGNCFRGNPVPHRKPESNKKIYLREMNEKGRE